MSQWPVSSLHGPAAFNRAPSWEPRRLSASNPPAEVDPGECQHGGAETGTDAGLSGNKAASAHARPEPAPVPPHTPPSPGAAASQGKTWRNFVGFLVSKLLWLVSVLRKPLA